MEYLLCRRTTVLCTTHLHAITPTPRVTHYVITRAKQALDAFSDRVDNGLLQRYCNEVPRFKDTWYTLFELVLTLPFHGTICGDYPNHLVTTNALIKRLHNVIDILLFVK